MAHFSTHRCRHCRVRLGKVTSNGVLVLDRPVSIDRVLAYGVPITCESCDQTHIWTFHRSNIENWAERGKPDDAGDVLPSRVIIPLQVEEVLERMEERWQSFRVSRLRQRGTVAVGLRFDVFMRDHFRCRYCGASAESGALLHADHVIPESKGGPTTMDNLVTACSDCNLGKSDKDLTA